MAARRAAPKPPRKTNGGAATQPVSVPVPPTEFVPLTHVTVLGQPREDLGQQEPRHGFTLTERGWEKEKVQWQT